MDVRAEQERGRLERKRAALDRDVTRLVDASQAGILALTALAERCRRIEDQGRMRRERGREIDQQRRTQSAELWLLEGGDALCPSVCGAMAESSVAVQQKMLQLGANRIVMEDHPVIIEHGVPTGPVRLYTAQLAPGGPERAAASRACEGVVTPVAVPR